MNVWLKRFGVGLACLAGFVVLTAAGVYGYSETRYRKSYVVPHGAPSVRTDSAAVERGGHLAKALVGCTDCHGADLGGNKVIDDPALGIIYGPNLTTGKGVVGKRTDAEYEHAIRHGVGPNGHPLRIMPSLDYVNMSDADVAAIIAYLKSAPPVDRSTPAIAVGPVGRTLMVAGKLPMLTAERIDHARPSIASVTPSTTAGYGAYLTGLGCKGCHSQTLAGGPIEGGDPAWPPAANLTPGGPTREWTEDNFKALLHTGMRPDGTPINDVMPWRNFANLTDDEMHAIWLYLRSVPAVATPAK